MIKFDFIEALSYHTTIKWGFSKFERQLIADVKRCAIDIQSKLGDYVVTLSNKKVIKFSRNNFFTNEVLYYNNIQDAIDCKVVFKKEIDSDIIYWIGTLMRRLNYSKNKINKEINDKNAELYHKGFIE